MRTFDDIDFKTCYRLTLKDGQRLIYVQSADCFNSFIHRKTVMLSSSMKEVRKEIIALKKRQVDISVVEHQADASIRVQIQYDKNEQMFHATYAGNYYSGKTEREVYTLVYILPL